MGKKPVDIIFFNLSLIISFAFTTKEMSKNINAGGTPSGFTSIQKKNINKRNVVYSHHLIKVNMNVIYDAEIAFCNVNKLLLCN
jgi:hypothetical protein